MLNSINSAWITPHGSLKERLTDKSSCRILEELHKKMQQEWMANGCRLAWLIDAQQQTTYIYRPNQEPETVVGFTADLSGEEILPGFQLVLGELA